ncbi:hypothetical protein CLOM_g17562 [Closterium sp. NIES-68]|nr:hypothetical protein CLOM_g17562 [Closterium sp. NIES-68]GJP61184.1 hypothetical protein CLOP_g18374 [Closterium sp. NIES-67]
MFVDASLGGSSLVLSSHSSSLPPKAPLRVLPDSSERAAGGRQALKRLRVRSGTTSARAQPFPALFPASASSHAPSRATSTRAAPATGASWIRDVSNFAVSRSSRLTPDRPASDLRTSVWRGEGGGSSSSSGSGSGKFNPRDDDLVELPLFPLPLVLFPGTALPLQIFEFRYRIMMQTLLQTDMRFGIIYTGKDAATAAAVGCVGQVIRHERLPDNRFFLICRGEERFRVVDIVRSRPYLVGRVRWLEDKPSEQPVDIDSLANEVADIMHDVIRMSNKMRGSDEEVPDLRKSSFPTPFSFWVASTFEGAPAEQQVLLELEDTAERLQREKETLRSTLNYLTAASAVKDVFSSPSDK